MESLLRAKVIVDGRNLYNPDRLQGDGWHYYGVGRARSAGRSVGFFYALS